MTFPSVTNTFVNGTTADATAVNQNFTDIINAFSDGSKSQNISALTCLGLLTASANVVLGASSANTLTINASLAQSLLLNANNTYFIGGTTLGLAGIYLGAPSARTTLLKSNQSLAGSITLALPIDGGAANQLLKTDGSGNMSWVAPNVYVLQAKTTTYAQVATDDDIYADTSGGAWSLSLLNAATAGLSGKKITVRKTTSDLSALTISSAAGGSILENGASGTTTTLNTIGETIVLQTDGTNWRVNHRIIPTNLGSSITFGNQGLGTLVSSTYLATRRGNILSVNGVVVAGGNSAVTALLTLTNTAIDTAKLTALSQGQTVGEWWHVPASTVVGGYYWGNGVTGGGATFQPGGPIGYDGSSASSVYYSPQASSPAGFKGFLATNFLYTSSVIGFRFEVPISGWNS